MDKIIAIISVFRREIKMIIRDADLITIVLLSPLFYAFFYTSIYFNKTENEVAIAIIDMDHSALSQSLIRSFDAHQMIKVNDVVNDYASGVNKIYSMEDHALIYIPKDFESSLKQGKGTTLKLMLNTSRFLVSNDLNKGINEVAGTFAAGVRIKYFEAQGFSIRQAKEIIEPVRTEIKSLFNPGESYGDFLIPGLLVLILQQTLLIGLSESISKERENNSLKDLFETAQNNIWATITGKGLYYFLLYSGYATLFYVIHFAIFKISFKGTISGTIILTTLFLISVIYLSILISSFFNRKIVSLQFFAFTSYPVFLLSGYSWPAFAMPEVVKYFSYILPVTPYINAINRITQMGAGITDVLPEIIHLLILTTLGLLLTRLRMYQLFKESLKSSSI